MRRFTIAPERIADGRVVFDAEESRHLARVVRLRPGDTVIGTDGAGHEYAIRLEAVGARVTGRVLGRAEGVSESPLEMTLVQGLPRGDKLESIVRAATELGATRILPAVCARTVVRLAPARALARVSRWQRVAREAAKQSGRAVVPAVEPPRPLAAWLDAVADADLRLCVWEEETRALHDVLAGTPRLHAAAVLIGPEGGLTRAEVEAARERGWQCVGLGRRLLRTETAGPALMAILQHRFGDLGTPIAGGPI